MLKVGLTGGIGSGKSTVAEIFSRLGITVIDADIIAHQLTLSGSESFNEIVQLFGKEFIGNNGELDRKKIAQTIFSNLPLKIALEKILHPKIRRRIEQEIEQAKNNDYIILAIPLLLESNFTDLVDRIIVIDADDETRIKRTHQRDGRTENQIRQIMNQQFNRHDRLQQADDILINNGDLEDLEDAVIQLHHKYSAMSA
ncbi:dephospho-CoA kinase [Pseudomonadota bacterium]